MLVIAVSVGFTVAVAVAGIVSAAIVPKPTLQIAQHASVTDQAHKTTVASIVVNVPGRAVYQLSGDSARHPKCTQANGCFQFWPPVKVASVKSLHKASAISGKLGTWHRDGFLQVTLNGHPLYTFALDSRRHAATGEAVKSFKGTWHVLRGKSTSPPPPTTTSTSTTSTTPCLYPPCH
ncbi:MAG: COG4315 family predicted lipoprotein [Solirubrobacteraceae bacterium]